MLGAHHGAGRVAEVFPQVLTTTGRPLQVRAPEGIGDHTSLAKDAARRASSYFLRGVVPAPLDPMSFLLSPRIGHAARRHDPRSYTVKTA